MAPKKNNKSAAASSSGSVPRENKTPKELKVTGKLAKKSNSKSAQLKDAQTTRSSQARNKEKKALATGKLAKKFKSKSAQLKDVKTAPLSQARNKEKDAKDGNQGDKFVQKDARKSENMDVGNKEKGSTSEMNLDAEKVGKTEKGLGGVIFMCNAKTKADCFRYRVMGVSAGRNDIIMAVKPGLKLFLFDVDLKLMYGIYEASSAGGMKLEPAAFGGGFPAQVRFRIEKDCIPVPENVFRTAIQDNYDPRTRRFKTELTFKQVERLRKLFKPAPWLHQTSQPSEPVIQPPLSAPFDGDEPLREHAYGMQYNRSKAGEHPSSYVHERHQLAGHRIMARDVDSQSHFMDKEYRSYGLQSAQHQQLTPSAVVGRSLDQYESEQRRELGRYHTSARSDAALARKETVYSEPLFPSERDYRAYGLKGCGEIPATVPPTVESGTAGISPTPTNLGLLNGVKGTYNPYDESTTSLVNRYLSLPRTPVASVEPYSSAGRESLVRDSYSAIDIRGHTGRFHAENERAYPPYVSHLPPDYGLSYHHLRDEPKYSTSVSSRYPFAPGSSRPHR